MNIAVIGAGTMGRVLTQHLSPRTRVVLCDRNENKGRRVAEETGSNYEKDVKLAISQADVVILAIKPKDLPALSHQLSPCLEPRQVLISLLAGTSLSSLEGVFPHVETIIRIMPNLAIQIGKGVVGFSSHTLQETNKALLEQLFSSLGLLLWVEEAKMEAFASLAASSPAFILILLEAMVESGIHLGFTSQESRKLAATVLEGTALLALQSPLALQELKWQIASPGGMTIEGMRKLEDLSFKGSIQSAIEASYHKALQLTPNANN